MRRLRITVAGFLLLALLIPAFFRVGPLPALGSLLDPMRGVWALARRSDLPRESQARIPGLQRAVEVRYDDRAVPHIFAATPEDAYRALGYVVARDRLFQLELQTRAAAGTLTELVGAGALSVDRGARRLGLAWSAERAAAALDSASVESRAIRAYADGVNAWLDQMTPADLPLEYRLLGATPARWKPEHTYYLFRRMGQTLAYGLHELTRQRIVQLIGPAATDALFPVHHPIQEPIVPGPGPYPRFDFSPIPAPTTPAMSGPSSPREGRGEGVGSNNWAVAPSRSATGHALLAGDPHLDLTLPSIWYEAHLVVPGQFDVYGVTLPGQPAVIIGFNRDVAWSFTNTGADVLDFYAEIVDDADRPTQYRVDGEWRRVERRIEHFRGRRGEPLAVDTIYHTHRGPMRREGDGWLSMRWLVLEAGGGGVFLDLARARNAEQWLTAMAPYVAPAQNGLVADRFGNIAARSTGWFPLRPRDGLGARVRDGSTSASDWIGYWPLTRYPTARNPRQGFLASANQEPTDPRVDPGYLEADWFDPWRALRINALLRADSAVTVDAIRRYQTDPGSARADLLVPAILAAAEAADAAEVAEGGPRDGQLREAITLLAEWDRRYTIDNRRAVLFEMTVDALERRLWDELDLPTADGGRRRAATPRESLLLALLRERTSVWWDDRATPNLRETRDHIVAASLRAALADARQHHGDPEGDGWRWDRVQRINIHHLLRIPSFSARDLPVQGGPSTLTPNSGSGTHSASWRMVVELGDEVKAWGTYPGGQSGSPASRRYDDRIELWRAGRLDSLRFPRSAAEIEPANLLARLTLTPEP